MFNMSLIGIGSLLLAAACSDDGGSGVDGSKRFAELSDAELEAACTYIAELEGPERTFACSGGGTITVGIPASMRNAAIAECVANGHAFASAYPSCGRTVAQSEACYEAVNALTDDALCNDEALPAACSGVLVDRPVSCGGTPPPS